MSSFKAQVANLDPRVQGRVERAFNKFRQFIANNPNAQCSARKRGVACIAADGSVKRFRHLEAGLLNSLYNRNVQLENETQSGMSTDSYIANNMSALSWSLPSQSAFSNQAVDSGSSFSPAAVDAGFSPSGAR